MPVRTGKDKKGRFAQWGGSGKKYYFKNESGKEAAKKKASKQGQAAHAAGYRER